MTKIAGSGSISQRHGSADPDQDPIPYQNVIIPEHCYDQYRTWTLKVSRFRHEPTEVSAHQRKQPRIGLGGVLIHEHAQLLPNPLAGNL
jgi:hypothetical protein